MQQIFVYFAGYASGTDFTNAGVLGVVLFTVALAVWPVANRLRESEALVRRQEIDLANLAQLSQYIVQHLRESILVVDTEDRIRLINESAAQMLGDSSAYPGRAARRGLAAPAVSAGDLAPEPTGAPPDASAYLRRGRRRARHPAAFRAAGRHETRRRCWCSSRTRA